MSEYTRPLLLLTHEKPPAKPPRRMLQPTKDTLRAEIRYLEERALEQRQTIEIMNRELEASREAYQRLWAKTHGLRRETLLDRARWRISAWWNRRGFANGGLTGRGDPALIASRDNQSEETP